MAKEDTNLLFKQYKLCVQLAEGLNKQRQSVNYTYMLVIGALAILFTVIPDIMPKFFVRSGHYVVILMVMGASVLWMWALNSLYALRDEKRRIIMEMEKELPKQPLTDEWENYEQAEEKKESSHSVIETWLPKIIFLICTYFMLGTFIKYIAWAPPSL